MDMSQPFDASACAALRKPPVRLIESESAAQRSVARRRAPAAAQAWLGAAACRVPPSQNIAVSPRVALARARRIALGSPLSPDAPVYARPPARPPAAASAVRRAAPLARSQGQAPGRVADRERHAAAQVPSAAAEQRLRAARGARRGAALRGRAHGARLRPAAQQAAGQGRRDLRVAPGHGEWPRGRGSRHGRRRGRDTACRAHAHRSCACSLRASADLVRLAHPGRAPLPLAPRGRPTGRRRPTRAR
jgi:hypothetical protein